MADKKTTGFDYNLIKMMNEVIISGNLSKAANNLNLSIPAVSTSINRLKLHFGDTLFYRTSEGLKPTNIALEINSAFVKAMTIIEEVIKSNGVQNDSTSSLRIICPDVIESYYLLKFIKKNMEFPHKIEVSKHTGCSKELLLQSLLQEKTDIVIGNTSFAHEKITSRKLCSFNDFIVVCGLNSMLATNKTLTLAHYYSLPHACYCDYLIGEIGDIFGGAVCIDTPQTGLIKETYLSSSVNGVVNALENGNMLAIFPRNIADHFINEYRSRLAKFELPPGIEVNSSSIYINYITESFKKNRIHQMVKFLESIE